MNSSLAFSRDVSLGRLCQDMQVLEDYHNAAVSKWEIEKNLVGWL